MNRKKGFIPSIFKFNKKEKSAVYPSNVGIFFDKKASQLTLGGNYGNQIDDVQKQTRQVRIP